MTEAEKGYAVAKFANEQLNKIFPGQVSSLADRGWIFGWCRSKRTVGWCKFDRKTIELSPYYLHETMEKLQDTILHEIAHAFAGHSAGHGPEWQRWCLIVGAKPQRCAIGYQTSAEYRWVGICNHCGYQHKMHRKPKDMHLRYHAKCGPVNGILTWRQNG